MSVGSGAVGVRRRFLPGTRAAVLAALLVAVLAVSVIVGLWTATSGSNAPGGADAFEIAPQLHPKGGLVQRIAEPDRGEVVVRGEVCELCWKYR